MSDLSNGKIKSANSLPLKVRDFCSFKVPINQPPLELSEPSLQITDFPPPLRPDPKFFKILIVDDEKFNCDIFYGFLLILGCKNREKVADFANSGLDAVKKVKENLSSDENTPYVAIFMDSSMPFMDGYEATKEIRSLYEAYGVEKELQP